MSKFTKEEISLCKQVAEKHRKEIEYGDWYSDPMRKEGHQVRLCEYQGKQNFGKIYSEFIPLWTISDCLEFLEDLEVKAGNPELWKGGRSLKWYCRTEYSNCQEGKTPLEACLKAVLAVLEEEK